MGHPTPALGPFRSVACPLLVTCALLTFGCQPPSRAPLRLGINPWPGYEFLYLAQERGLFANEGLDVRLLEFSSLSDSRRAFERRQIDGMACTLIEVIQAYEISGRSAAVALVSDYSDGGDQILARGDVRSIADLRGKRIGAEAASLSTFLLARAFERAGLALDDAELVDVDPTEMERRLREGDLDAVVTYPPVSVHLARDPDVRTLFSSADVPGEIVDVVAIDRELLEARPEIVGQLQRVWDRVLALAAAEPDRSDALMARRERISIAEFRQALTGLELVAGSEQPARDRGKGSLADQIGFALRAMRTLGLVTRPPDVALLLPPESRR